MSIERQSREEVEKNLLVRNTDLTMTSKHVEGTGELQRDCPACLTIHVFSQHSSTEKILEEFLKA